MARAAVVLVAHFPALCGRLALLAAPRAALVKLQQEAMRRQTVAAAAAAAGKMLHPSTTQAAMAARA